MTASVSPSSYVAISRRALDLEDYIDLARRHMVWIIGPTFAGLVISIVVAFALPNVYISEATMQIIPPQMPESIVKTTISQQLTDRINFMEQQILSRTSLSNMIQDPRLDLYKSDRAKQPIEDVIENMRSRDIRISISSLPGDRRASAFKISFQYPDRVKAHDTVQMFISKFEDANQASQHNQQSMVGNFVKDEVSSTKAKLDELEQQLEKFRGQNAGKLPEQLQLNMTQMTALQQRSAGLNDDLNRLAQERIQLDAQLQTQERQLEMFNMFVKQVALTPPAMVRQNERLLSLSKTITDGESQLALLRQTYSGKYPDIRDAEARLQQLRNERDKLQKEQDAEQNKPKDPPNLVTSFQQAQSVNAVQGQIDETKARIQALELEVANRRKEQAELNKQLQASENRLAGMSGLETTYADLVRDVQAAREKYQTAQSKEQMSDQNSDVLQRKAGEVLEVLDPPSLPQQPSSPKRWLIVGAGTGIAFMLGIVLAGVQEAKDTSLKNLKDVRAYTNLPVLSSIPLLENTMLVRRKRRIAYLAWSAAVIVGILAVGASLYYHYTYAV